MMYKEKSKRAAMVKYLLALPVLAAMLFIFSSSQIENDSQNNFGDEGILLKIEDHNKYSSNGLPITLLEIKQKIDTKNPKFIDLNYNHSTFINSVQPIAKIANKANVDIHLNNGGIDRLASVFREDLDKEPDYRYNSNDEKFKLIEGSKNLFDLKSDVFKAQKLTIDQGDPIYKVVEEMPRFPGCESMEASPKEIEDCAMEKMLEFIYSQLKYPAKARENNIEGMTVVQFVVEKDGSISGGKIVREIGGDAGAESLRVVNSMPTWLPGKRRGEPVRVLFTLPVKYKLESNNVSASEKDQMPNVVALGEKSDVAIKNNLEIHRKNITSGNNDKEELFKVVEEMPRFAGCEDEGMSYEEKIKCARQKMLEFIYSNVKYPKEARNNGIEGMAIIQFVIEKDGSVSSSRIVRDPGLGTGAEAKRVVEMMPKWIPGKQRGQKVRVQYTLPVKYKLEGDKESVDKPKISKSVEIHQNQFTVLENINPILKAAGFSDDCSVEKFNLVYVAPKKEAYVFKLKTNELSNKSMEYIKKANVGDHFFIEGLVLQCQGMDNNKQFDIAISIIANVPKKPEVQNSGIELFQNVPNPFREQTVIGFNLTEAAPATVTVFDVTGKVIAKNNINGVKGYNTVNFTASQLGILGVCYYSLESGEFAATKKMVIIEP